MTKWYADDTINSANYPYYCYDSETPLSAPMLERSDGGRRYRVIGDISAAFWAKDLDEGVLKWMTSIYPNIAYKENVARGRISLPPEMTTFDDLIEIQNASTHTPRMVKKLVRVSKHGPIYVRATLTITRSYGNLESLLSYTSNVVGVNGWEVVLPEESWRSQRIPFIGKNVHSFIAPTDLVVKLVRTLNGKREEIEFPPSEGVVDPYVGQNYDYDDIYAGLDKLTDDEERISAILVAWKGFIQTIEEQTGIPFVSPNRGNALALLALARGESDVFVVPSEIGQTLKEFSWDHTLIVGPDGGLTVTCERGRLKEGLQAYELAAFKDELQGTSNTSEFISAWISQQVRSLDQYSPDTLHRVMSGRGKASLTE
jgi:hypothetical protein